MGNREIEKELPKALIGWYPFKIKSKVLFISDGFSKYEVIYDLFKDKEVDIRKNTMESIKEITEKFDYIVLTEILEKYIVPSELLIKIKKLLNKDGKLLIFANNRLGIRYFCGDKDEYTGHVLDSLDNYAKVSLKRRAELAGRSYSKDELKNMLINAGFRNHKFYSVMPTLVRPQVIISEDYIPNEALDIRVFPQYNSHQTIFLEEENLYDDILKNGMFHSMANGFFIECSLNGELTDIDQVTVSGDRGPENALATIIKKEKQVSKKALYPEGKSKISELMENTIYLKEHNVPMIEAKVEGDSFIMPYVDGEIATLFLRNLLRNDKGRFIKELEFFRDILWHSSEHVPFNEINWQQFEPGWEKRKADDPNIDKWEKLAFGSKEDQDNIGPILKRGYIDLVSLNCFHNEDGYIFFDQEFYIENLPLNVIFIRTIDLIYRGQPYLEAILSREEVLKYFKLWEHASIWRKFISFFMQKLRKEKELASYHKRYRRETALVASNRHRMDYTQEEYDKLFKNIFKGIEGKKIYLFGSGQYSEQFISRFSQYYEIAGILDNNKEKWGTKLSGIEISSPDILKEIEVPFKIFICIKYYDDVLEQLKSMGIREISIYDPRLEYERPLKQISKSIDEEPKKYHIGYIAGVFDLFHIGHLNMFKRAKELCDYLIVGVVSDEQVIRDKKTSPYIPFEERIEIVDSCKYVDEAVRIPENNPGTEEAYRLYHFDVQFSGSDYADDPDWLAKKVYLQQRGSDLIFFPYTQSTSSTKLKEKMSGDK